jgi:predicted transcriptional regulator
MDTIFRKLEATLFESRPKAKKAKPMPATNSANEIRIIQAAEENPRVSQTVLARQVGISQPSISRILKANKFPPYQVTSAQELTEDRQKNVSCTFILNK